MGSKKATKKSSRAQSEDFHEIGRPDEEPGDINVFSDPQTTQARGVSDEVKGDSTKVPNPGTDGVNTHSDFSLPPPLKPLGLSPRRMKSARQKETFLRAPGVFVDSFTDGVLPPPENRVGFQSMGSNNQSSDEMSMLVRTLGQLVCEMQNSRTAARDVSSYQARQQTEREYQSSRQFSARSRGRTQPLASTDDGSDDQDDDDRRHHRTDDH